MKKLTVIAAVILIMMSCGKDNNPVAPEESSQPSINTGGSATNTDSTAFQKSYFGCWTPIYVTGAGAYDVILTENDTIPHGFEYGNSCIPIVQIPIQNLGVFRNDTLILDDGIGFEHWVFIESDTLWFGSYTQATYEKVPFLKN